MNADALDAALAHLLGTIPDGWEFHGIRPDGQTPLGWQAMAWRSTDNAWAIAQGPSPGAAVAALASGDLRTIPSLEQGGIEPACHPTVQVVLDGEPTPIDEEIAPLVEAVAQAGLVTTSSCQRGLGGRAILDFDSVEDAAVFLAVAAQDFSLDVASLWNRIFVENEPEEWQHFRRERMWTVSASAQDHSVEYGTDADGNEVLERTRPAAIDFRIGVAFPPSDIPTITELILQHNARES